MESAARFLSAREIIALSQTCADARVFTNAQVPREIAARFPGRARAGDDLDAASRIPDWRFFALLEDRGEHSLCFALDDARDIKRNIADDIHLLNWQSNSDLLIDWINARFTARDRAFLLRGDSVVTKDESRYYWTGCYFAISTGYPIRLPRCFKIPLEFAPDYFSSEGYTQITFDLARYRAQLLRTLRMNRSDPRFYVASFTEHGREYVVKFVTDHIMSLRDDIEKKQEMIAIYDILLHQFRRGNTKYARDSKLARTLTTMPQHTEIFAFMHEHARVSRAQE